MIRNVNRLNHVSRILSLLTLLLAFVCAMGAPLAEERAMTGSGKWKAKCPKISAKPLVYGVGSSTMGTSLGKSLKSKLKEKGIGFRKWGKASSGLARPEFHDWPKSIKQVVREKKPDIFVISLGTNDFQALYNKGKWIKLKQRELWKSTYRSRIEDVLEKASGRDRKRMVVWITPTIFNSSKAKRAGKWIHDLIVEVAHDFGGPVFVVDAYERTTKNGEPLQFFKTAEGKTLSIFGDDKIHLTQAAVEHLMARPVLKLIEPCLPK